MSDDARLRSLYRDIVLTHSREPHNFRRMEDPQSRAEGHNPLCGDKITMYLKRDDDTLSDVCFEAVGCAISIASASILTDMTRGQPVNKARTIAAGVLSMLEEGNDKGGSGEMTALAGVRAYPSRVRCATLAWRTFQAALAGTGATVTTEQKDH